MILGTVFIFIRMAENKNKIIVYRDWISTFENLSDDEAGKLIKHFFRYVNDKNPEPPDRLTGLIFEPIKQTLKRDLKSFESKCLKNKDNAFIRWHKTDAIASERIKRNANHADNDNDNDIDIDIDIIDKHNVIKSNEKKSKTDFLDRIIQSFVDVHGEYEIINRGKERMATAKLLGIYKKKYPDSSTEETIAGLQAYFVQCVNIPDQWLKENMSIPIILSQFNKINTILKNGNTKKSSGATDHQIATVIAKHFGNG